LHRFLKGGVEIISNYLFPLLIPDINGEKFPPPYFLKKGGGPTGPKGGPPLGNPSLLGGAPPPGGQKPNPPLQILNIPSKSVLNLKSAFKRDHIGPPFIKREEFSPHKRKWGLSLRRKKPPHQMF